MGFRILGGQKKMEPTVVENPPTTWERVGWLHEMELELLSSCRLISCPATENIRVQVL